MANAEPSLSPPSVSTPEKFAPNDGDLWENYLRKRIEGQLPPTNFIKEADDAFTTRPDQLFSKYEIKMEDEGYFFSPLKESFEGKIATDGGGFWRYRSMRTSGFRDANGAIIVVRRKKVLHFIETNQTVEDFRPTWSMEEYSIPPNAIAPNNSKNKVEGEEEGAIEANEGGEREEEAIGGGETNQVASIIGPEGIPNKVGDIVLCKIYNTDYLKKPEAQVEEAESAAAEEVEAAAAAAGGEDVEDVSPVQSSCGENEHDDDTIGARSSSSDN